MCGVEKQLNLACQVVGRVATINQLDSLLSCWWTHMGACSMCIHSDSLAFVLCVEAAAGVCLLHPSWC